MERTNRSHITMKSSSDTCIFYCSDRHKLTKYLNGTELRKRKSVKPIQLRHFKRADGFYTQRFRPLLSKGKVNHKRAHAYAREQDVLGRLSREYPREYEWRRRTYMTSIVLLCVTGFVGR